MDLFGSAHGWGVEKGSLPKICHTYPTMRKHWHIYTYIKKIHNKYKSRDTPLAFCWYQHFFSRNQQLSLYQDCRYSLHFNTYFLILLISIWVFKDCFNKHGCNFDVRKIKVFWNEGYGVIIAVHDVTNKILSRDLSCIIDQSLAIQVFLWEKLS